ncbi:MAG: flagellar basal body P-ring protein FlgI [Pseudomonadales bacterium]|nr:flagellar basal body P-ring protein FlgI [Pseudomonadales bacterium]MCP5184730.1 flagellar basal body P-ring protein FlgI [Pseudomonadales bacterium]
MRRSWLLVVLAFVTGLQAHASSAQRVKDLASIAGVRSNQLVGYGLVVGLNGSGDQTTQTPFTVQTFNNMLREFGIQLPPGTSPQLKNVAAVSVHAELPPFAKPGQRIDVTVSSIGNAKSLRGGVLLVTPLKGLNGQVFAVAQGNLVVGGFGAEGNDGSSITVNVPSVGRIPGGANVEAAAPDGFNQSDHIVFNLHRSDFTTARRLVEEINSVFGPDVAEPMDAGSIAVRAPVSRSQRIAFVSELENLVVTPDDSPARVVINSRTGTIVIGSQVRVSPAAVTHGSLTVTIAENLDVSQPAPLSEGQTAVVPRSNVEATQEANRMFYFAPGVALQDIVTAVNDVGAAPGDLMAILEALRESGALQAELVVI